MEMTQFFDSVEQHPELQGIGIDPCSENNPGVIVKYSKNGLMTRIPVAAVEAADWPVLEEVLTGKREPQVLQHMTRVVGYFSRVENWNKSKVGELKDRQKGNYSIAG
ncbi:MAG: anaerobic ribonucleoside-triphosphate reductase [Planctomycetaceae bacterium]|nr:anaerobic ribonucleoside-triphosphate reductase [Planctomycetaceae bacterium]